MDLRSILLASALALSWSCYSLSLVQEPQVLRPGTVRGTGGVSGQVGRSAILATGVRVGMFPGGEARLKLSWGLDNGIFTGTEVGLNLQPYDTERFAVFLMPHYRYFPRVEEDDDNYSDESFVAERRVQAFAVPSLFVVKLPRGHNVFFGPTGHIGTRDRTAFGAVGGHLGATLNVAADHLSVVPELGLLRTVMGAARDVDQYGHGQSLLTRGDTTLELGLSFSFGARH